MTRKANTCAKRGRINVKANRRRILVLLSVAIMLGMTFWLLTDRKTVRAATTFIVNNTDDVGTGSLRDALNRAQSGDTVRIVVTGQILTAGLVIRPGVTLLGPGANQVSIRLNFTITPPLRSSVFTLFGNNSDDVTTISGVTISEGRARRGGGIDNRGGNLVIGDCIITNNGAIEFIDDQGLDVGGAGGGIYNGAFGNLTVINCEIRGNGAFGPGGGIYCEDSSSLTVTNSLISGNLSRGLRGGPGFYTGGGGIFISNPVGTTVAATATITNSTISNNTSQSGGGGIKNSGFVSLDNCTISGNRGINTGIHADSGNGGGIENVHTATLTNCTIANNSAFSFGGGISSQGVLQGNITILPATLRNCTVTNNSTTNTGIGATGGGGIATSVPANLVLINTIVALNKLGNDLGLDTPDVTGAFTSLGHNLIGHTGDSNTGWQDTDKLDVDPMFVLDGDANPMLGNNGGPTQTVALRPGSPAIDGGDNSIIPDQVPNTDQRGNGFHRIVDGEDDRMPVTDIGAFELQANAYPTLTTNIIFVTQNTTLSPAILGTARDAETIPGDLTLLFNGAALATVNGVTVGGFIDTDGTIKADVMAECDADNANFTVQVIDGNNQSTMANLSVRITRAAPTVTCGDITTNAAPGQCSALISFNPTAQDACGTPLTAVCRIGNTVITSPATLPVGTTTVVCEAYDAVRNLSSTCSFAVIIGETTPPEISCPANITRSADPGQCSAAVSFAPQATDNCDQNPSIVCSPPSGSMFPKGTATVSCTAADATGNTAACSFTITVNDTSAPAINCADVTAQSVSADGNCAASVPDVRSLVRAQASDNCTVSADLVITQNPVQGSVVSGAGSHPITVTVRDSDNNSAICVVAFTVNDTTPPAIICPGNVVKATDPNLCSAIVAFAPTASDNCSGLAAPVCSPPSGTAFPKGATTVTCTVRDAANNQSAPCSFTVTVVDMQAPSIACPADQIRATASLGDAMVSITYPAPTASDNCTVESIVCTPPSGSVFPLGATTVTCTATDTSANTAMCSFLVTTFDVCLQDDSNSKAVLLWNSVTGDYRYCCNGAAITGRGTVSRQGNTFKLTHTAGDRRVNASLDASQNKGTASLQHPLGTSKCPILDRDTRNNTCQCAGS